MTLDLWWPDVFLKKNFKYKGKNKKMLALADGLTGWANCMVGADNIPEHFGWGMLKISRILDIDSTPESLMKLAKELRKND